LMTLSLREPAALDAAEAEALVTSAFDLDFALSVRPHRRYLRLFRKYRRRESFNAAEITDAVVLFNLAWVGEIFREGAVELETGVVVDLRYLFEKGGGYTRADVEALVAAQLEIMRAVVPLYKRLQREGRVELSTSPFYHPILPLLHDSDLATVDRPGACLPPRFAWPEDAREQVERAATFFEGKFGARPSGMWPAEGAVAEEVVPYFEEAGVRWIASDEGVLALSGRRDYEPGRPEMLLRPYRVGDGELAIFFRHHGLSDAIGFEYQRWEDADAAAADFSQKLNSLLSEARALSVHDALVSVILDGENAWGHYRRQGVPFLMALYRRLARGDVARAVTFTEYLDGAGMRGLAPHPPLTLERLSPLACASWIDEAGSLPGNDLGTWVGEAEENRAWELVGEARAALVLVVRRRPGRRRGRGVRPPLSGKRRRGLPRIGRGSARGLAPGDCAAPRRLAARAAGILASRRPLGGGVAPPGRGALRRKRLVRARAERTGAGGRRYGRPREDVPRGASSDNGRCAARGIYVPRRRRRVARPRFFHSHRLSFCYNNKKRPSKGMAYDRISISPRGPARAGDVGWRFLARPGVESKGPPHHRAAGRGCRPYRYIHRHTPDLRSRVLHLVGSRRFPYAHRRV
jgi:hypothetical protein